MRRKIYRFGFEIASPFGLTVHFYKWTWRIA